MRKFSIFLLLATATAALAATNQTDFGADALPTTKEAFWKWGIGAITPIIVWGLSKIPNIPRPILPTVTPLVGVGLGFLLNWLGKQNLGWVDMAQAGALGVFIREVVNQWATKQLQPTAEATKTDAVPIDRAIAVATVKEAKSAEKELAKEEKKDKAS